MNLPLTFGSELFWWMTVIVALHGIVLWAARRDVRFAWWSALVIGPVLALIVWLVATRFPTHNANPKKYRHLSPGIVFVGTLAAVAWRLLDPDIVYEPIFFLLFNQTPTVV